jgi:Tol biopolymer transport system component
MAEESLSVLHLKDGLPQALNVIPSSQAFYINEPVLDGLAVVFSGLAPGHWLKPSGGDAVKIADGSQWQVSPDRTRVVSYPKGEAGWFVDLRTGESHQVEAPGIYGSNVWDAWSPDGTRYLVQTKRTDPVPGFYLLDQNARRLSTWHEPGYYSFWASWSPDSRQIAYLSVPMDTVYPKHPEAWAEPQLAPRLGVLDLASGTARYFALEGRLLGGDELMWSPDNTKVATLCGDLQFEANISDVAVLSDQRVCVADVKTGTITEVAAPGNYPPGSDSGAGRTTLLLDSWAPDGKALVYGVHWNAAAPAEYYMTSVAGEGMPIPLPGHAVWIDNDRLAVVSNTMPQTLTLHDRQGKQLSELARGVFVSWVSLSPTGSHLAYSVNLSSLHASDPPSTYVFVVSTAP